MIANKSANHGGLIIPLDPIRLSQVAALCADVLVSKARNILDAQLVISRPLTNPILLLRIVGHVVGDDVAAFWRDNADIATTLSQALPRQVFLYYAEPGPYEQRREGFLVAQRGQVLAADDATAERIPPGAGENEWPVARLCQQLRVALDDLAAGFPEGPHVQVALADPHADDQALLMTLAGQPPEEDEEVEGAPPPRAAGAAPAAAPRAAAGPGGAARPTTAPRMSVDEDAKRRAKEQAAESQAMAERAQQVRAGLPFATDDLGVVVAPKAELSEPDILRPFIVAKVDGDLPLGVPSNLTDQLQGKRIDIAVVVEFLSEVFIESKALNRGMFEELSRTERIGQREVRVLEVLAPRLGYGTLVSTGKRHVFVSRRLGSPLPAEFVERLLAG